MNLTVNQQITIHQLKVGQVNNSSVLQIGAAGLVKPLSYRFHTGGFDLPGGAAGSTWPVPVIMAPLPAVERTGHSSAC